MEYIRRVVDDELDELLPGLPAVALEGPKAVGKTATALQRAATVHQLDDEAQLEIAIGDPNRLVEGRTPVLIDEWQRLPSSWDLVRRAVDSDGAPGRFILTGSATPSGTPIHSGAGRIATLRMRPLSLAERAATPTAVSLATLLREQRPPLAGDTDWSLTDYADEIIRSGFPGIRGLSGRVLRTQLDGYINRIAEHEFEALGQHVRSPNTLRRWMTAYAAATSTTASFEVIRDAATSGQADKPARSTVIPYRNTLEQLWLIDEVPAWLPSRNHIRRLGESPRHHLADPALAARLLGANIDALLDGTTSGPAIPRDGPLLGALFESLVTLSVRVYAQANEARVSHLRTRGGEHEVDVIVERGDGKIVALEVKLARAVTTQDGRHLRWLAEQVGPDLLDAAIITTGPEAYRRPDGIGVIPAVLLGM